MAELDIEELNRILQEGNDVTETPKAKVSFDPDSVKQMFELFKKVSSQDSKPEASSQEPQEEPKKRTRKDRSEKQKLQFAKVQEKRKKLLEEKKKAKQKESMVKDFDIDKLVESKLQQILSQLPAQHMYPTIPEEEEEYTPEVQPYVPPMQGDSNYISPQVRPNLNPFKNLGFQTIQQAGKLNRRSQNQNAIASQNAKKSQVSQKDIARQFFRM